MMLPDPKLRLPIALLIAAVLLGAGIFHFSLNARLASEARLMADEARAEQAERALREAPARLIQDQADAALHSRISNSGFIGPENRIGWISALAKTQAQLHLASLSWRMSPQSPSMLAPKLYVSQMELNASPLDLAGLTALIEHLRAVAPGRFTVEHCALALDPTGSGGQANCRLNWWTLAPHEN